MKILFAQCRVGLLKKGKLSLIFETVVSAEKDF